MLSGTGALSKAAVTLLVITLALLTVGVIVLFSTSAVYARERYGDPHYLLKRQLAWMLLGGLVCTAAAGYPYPRLRAASWLGIAVAAMLLALVLVPQFGVRVGGARRWLSLGAFRFQPSELAKFALVLWLAHWLAREQRRLHRWDRGFVIPMGVAGGLMVLVLVEPDFGSTALLGAVTFALMFVAGVPLRFLVPTVVAALAGFGVLILHSPVRAARFLAFLDLEKYKAGAGYQVYQAILAFGSGGWSGLGLGNSRQKMFYLPEAHTDFIFPIVGEEMGLIGTLGVLLAFGLLVGCAAAIALRAPDPFGRYLGLGLTLLIALQVLINIGVVTAWLPTKGLPLPFISFGGSNLVMNLAAVGVLLSIYRYGAAVQQPAEQGYFAEQPLMP